MACSKDDDTKPDTDNTDNTEEPTNNGSAETLQKQILGKWVIDDNSFIIESAVAKAGLKAIASNHKASTKIASTNTANVSNAFIEFLADGTFIVFDNNGYVSTGNYTAKDGQTIDLTGFGAIKDIKFENDNINCVIHYDNKTLTIKAKKSAVIPASDRAILLCRTWQVERIENGSWYNINWVTNNDTGTLSYETVWQESVWENGVWTHNVEYEDIHPVEFKQFIVHFSPSGTYLAQIYDKENNLIEASVEYWKWHPNNQNKLITWTQEEIEPTSDYDDYTTDVVELTQLKLLIESHGDDDDYQHMTFKAVN
jgi:hypothetical protein